MSLKVIASGRKTIMDLTDGMSLTAYLSTNQPRIQIYDSNSGTVTPDWSTTGGKLVITPSVFLNQNQLALTDSRVSITWKRKVGSGTEGNLTTGESVSGGILTVTANKLTDATGRMITYVAHVSYTDNSTSSSLTATSEATFTQTQTGSNAHTVSITGDQVFKIAANGTTITPASITLTATTQNVSVVKWEYRNSNGSWQDYPTGTITGNTLTVAPSHVIWNDNVATLRVTTSDNAVYDTISIYKVSDGNGIVSVEYQSGTSATTAPTGTWKNSPPSVSQGNYLWTRTTFSNGQVAYSVARQGVNGSAGANGINSATVFLYQRAASTPSKPSGNSTYAFATGALDPVPTGWSRSIPASDGNPCYVTTASAISSGSTDTIEAANWSAVVLLVEDGANGANGADGIDGTNGLNSATVYLYQRAASEPSAPSTKLTYNFSSGKLSSLPTGWSQSIPASNGNPCYVTTAAAVSASSSVDIPASSWSNIVVLVEEAPVVLLTNESISFAGNAEGKVAATTVTCNVVAYQGTKKVTPTVGTISGGISSQLTITKGSASNNEIPLTIQVTANSTLGGAGEQHGTISVPVTSPVVTTLLIHWSKVNTGAKGAKGDKGADGENAVVFTVYAPNGTVFTNHSGSLALNAQAYDGSTAIASGATYQWYKYASGSWQAISGATSATYSVSGDSVTSTASFKCEMTYNGTVYSDVITMTDKTDSHQASIVSTAGDVFQNGVGESILICRVWQNGTEVDPPKSTIYATSNPSSGAVGTFYYKIASNTAVTKLMRKSNSTTWTDVTNNATYKHTLTYTWYRRDIDGNPLDNGSAFATGKVIHVTDEDVDGKTTFICEVGTIAAAQFTIRDDTDITVSDTAPANPAINQLWLDTSVNPSVMKRYGRSTPESSPTWFVVNDTDAIRENIQSNYTELSGAIQETESNLNNQIQATAEQLRSELTMTDTMFQAAFERTVQRDIDQSIADVSDDLSNYQKTVRKYMRYDSQGRLTLGDEESNFKAVLTNQRLSFMENDSEVAYISNRSMYITNARVTDTLSIGTDNGYGYFDWVVTATGLGLKWRSDEVPAYDPSLSYNVGDRARYNSVIYECIVAIENGEAWTPAHWKEVT